MQEDTDMYQEKPERFTQMEPIEILRVSNLHTFLIDDLNKAIEMNPDFTIAYFCRANIRQWPCG